MISGPDCGGRTLYEVLGIPREADLSEIIRAYRVRSGVTHPDRPGGDAAEFQRVKFAYEILADADSRRDYDAHGALVKRDRTGQATEILQQILLQIIESADRLAGKDLVKLVGEVVDLQRQDFIKSISSLDIRVRNHKKVMARLKYTGGGEDILAAGIQKRLAELNHEILEAREGLELGDIALDMLKSHSFRVESLFGRRDDADEPVQLLPGAR